MDSTDVCECEHPRSQHKRQRDGCRALDCGCAKFSADLTASAAAQGVDLTRVLTTVAEVCDRQAADARRALGIPAAEAAAERLAAVERERGELAAEVALLRSEVESWRGQSGSQRTEIQRLEALLGDRRTELEQLRVEYGQARNALDREKERRSTWVVARDGGRGCMSCYQEIRRGESYEPVFDDDPDALRHVHCPDAAPAAVALYAYDAWSCLVDGGCGARYTTPDPAHPCGRLTPTRVTITHRTEGAPS